MKKKVLLMILAGMMILTTGCGVRRIIQALPVPEEKTQEETTIEPEEPAIPETERTEWGSDDFGYVTLSSDWHNFVTSDVSAEQNANMLQWQSNDMRKIVTLSAGNNSPEAIIDSIAASEEPGTYGKDVYGEEGDDYRLGYFGKKYEDEGIWLVVYTIATDYSDRTYYFSYEGSGYEDEDEFLKEAQDILITHSELKKTSLYRGMTGSSGTSDSSGSSSGSDSKIDASKYKPGDKYPIYDFFTKELIIEAVIPEGFTVDPEYCEEDLLVLNKAGSYESIWINGFTDYEVEDYLKLGHLNEEIYGKYSDVSAKMVEEYSLKNGMKVYALEIKYHSDEYNLDIHKYNVSIQKNDEIGVSFTLADSELKMLGYNSIREVIDILFPNF